MFHFHTNPERPVIYTLGTSNRTPDQFFALLKEHVIEVAVDIRSFPASRFPHFAKRGLEKSLPSQSIRYLHSGKELGGFRKGGYIAYIKSDPFRKGIERLEEIGRQKRTVFFCSERFPWRCHRRWVAGELVQRGWQVIHIIERGKVRIPVIPH